MSVGRVGLDLGCFLGGGTGGQLGMEQTAVTGETAAGCGVGNLDPLGQGTGDPGQ